MNSPQRSWPGDIHRELSAAGVRQVAYVPDAGQAELIIRCQRDNAMTAVPLTTEEEGIGVLAGAWLGGQRGVLLMQSSGIGNCVNMFGFARTCRMPLLLLATMRGQWGEFNPWQLPMGQGAQPVLEASDVMVFVVEEAAQAGEMVAAAARMVFVGSSSAAVLINQRVVGAKTFDKD